MEIKKYSEHDYRYSISDLDDIMVTYTDMYDVEYTYTRNKTSIDLYIFYKKKNVDDVFYASFDDDHRDLIWKAGEILKDLKLRFSDSKINRSALFDIRNLWHKDTDIMGRRIQNYVCYFIISIPKSNFR